MGASAASIVGLATAVLIGLAAGWLLARRARERAVAAARETATAGTFQLADELYARTKRATELESKLGAVRAQAGALKDAVAAADERVHVLEAEVDRLAALLRARDDEIASLHQPAAPAAPAVPPSSSRARRSARLPKDPRPAEQERAGDGNRRDDPKRARKEHRKKYGTDP
jgi:flagellar motility protein MotE (MotC chaperone)